MSIEVILSIVGAFGTVALTINAFFLKGIFQDLNAVRVELAAISALSAQRSEDIRDIKKRLHILETGE